MEITTSKEAERRMLYQLHDTATSGHLRISKTLQRVRERYYWVQCHQDVQQWCKSCNICAMRRGPPRAIGAPMAQHNIGAPMEKVAVDVLGPLPESKQGNKYLLIDADYFTKWIETFPICDQEVTTVAEIMVISRYVVPLILHSDQGCNFEYIAFADYSISRRLGPHPCTLSQTVWSSAST